MPRINIEDSLYKDARFLNLIGIVGIDTALGALVRAFTVAQEFWLKGCQPIPQAEWEKQMLHNSLIDVGLAKKQDGGFYISGSKEQFAWLVQKHEAGKKGGEKSGESRRSKIDNLERSGASVRLSEGAAEGSGANPLSLSPTLPLSLNSTSSSDSFSDYSCGTGVRGRTPSTRVSKATPRGCIPEFSHDEVCLEFLSSVNHRAQNAWLKTYPSVDWICHQVREAYGWCETNPHKAPKDVGRFVFNWLKRGFESYRKGLPSNTKTHAQKVEDANEALRRKFESESNGGAA